ncbi:hypothetical protein AST07_01540 [Staphylococcus saprophyticus]|jgi:uncharacterized membrane protein|uniref:Uncharacterized protein n=1 Tax=Staphylococcus saprophyticus subsp. saprophyticus (strain ATCC 15305 / DSM 20229 / NCIMB 8711 / NCTC 7292 / S-41) TaxID=342451 RepID=Q49US6_STAS1|nr:MULTISPECIES: hypothetical protein [Staphylococcus]CRV27664.1 Uncharacterised protein [Streptococcus equi subsp. equi]SIN55443.1 Uncharacterised protein [Mycobacteroides abscessus subsp. abscessus]AMG19065.1 hypothetical protein AL528_02005 [Staphylococcus saprophyticus]AMG34438.1 hypothetical protein AL494_12045 [Staphylococcus saprophyticus]ASE58090.1 hypothetical protein CEQ14_02150 [Staphylococcus saprophyticus]
MWIGSIILIIVGIVLLIINQQTSKKEGVSKKQSYISIGIVCIIIGAFYLIGQIIKALVS